MTCVLRSPGATGTPFALIAKLEDASHLSWTQHNLTPNTLYAFRVRANSLRGDSEWSPVTRLKTSLPSKVSSIPVVMAREPPGRGRSHLGGLRRRSSL